MTPLKTRVTRRTNTALDGAFGPDRDKRIVVSLLPGDGKGIPDVIELRPERTRRVERLAVVDIYRYAMRCRVNSEVLAKARARKEKMALRREAESIRRAEKRLTRNV